MDGCKINIFVNESLLLTVVAGYQAKLSLNTDRPVQLLFFLVCLLRHCSKTKFYDREYKLLTFPSRSRDSKLEVKKRVFRFF